MKAATILVLLLALASAQAGEKAANEITWENERVVVFKDGYCLVVKKGTATSDAEGRIVTEEVPDAAVLGTFWAAPVEGRLLSTHAGRETVTKTEKKKTQATDFAKALRANIGRSCEVRLHNGVTVTGVVHAVHQQIFRIEDQLLLLGQVQSLRIDDMATEYEETVEKKQQVKRLTFRFEGGEAKREIHLMYLRPGVRWIPTYRVDLPEEENGEEVRVSLQAEILNEAEDLLDVPIDLVVGVPNFRFKDVVSPMVLEARLRRAIAAAGASNRLQNIWQQTQMVPAGQRDPRDPQPGISGTGTPGDIRLPADIRAAGTQDLFVYSLPRLTLKKGHRASVPIFDAKAAMTHVYTFDHYLVHERERSRSRNRRDESPLRLSESQVWHQLELTNATTVPWTTGSVLLMRGGQPLAQEMLTYTPVRGKSRVPITVAVDLRARYSEKETARKDAMLRWAGDTYARIDLEGGVTLTSYKTEPVEIEVNVHLGGRAEEPTGDGEVILSPFRPEDWTSYRGEPDANNHSEIRWNVKLEPGKTVKVTTKYHFFVEH